MEKGLRYYRGLLVIPRNSKVIISVIGEFNGSAIGYHSGETKISRNSGGIVLGRLAERHGHMNMRMHNLTT